MIILKTIIFFSTPAQGHINAVYPIIKKMSKKYNIIVFSSKKYKDFILSLNAKFIEYPINFDDYHLDEITSNFYNLAKNLMCLNKKLYKLLINEIQKINPDLIIYDSMCSFGKLISYKLNIKSVCFVTTLAFNWYIYFFKGMFIYDIPLFIKKGGSLLNLIKSERDFRKEFKLPKLNIMDLFINETDKTLVFTPPEFQPLRITFPSNFYFIGTTIKDRLKDSAKDINTEKFNVVDIYISLGTIFTEKEFILSKFVDMYKNSTSNIVISARKLFKNYDNYDNIISRKNINQLKILKKSRIFVNHAGLNSVYESIYLGTYQVCIPQQNEQLLVAKIIQKKNLGKYLRFKNNKNFFKKIKYEDYSKNINKYSKIFKKYNATKIAIDIINDYISD